MKNKTNIFLFPLGILAGVIFYAIAIYLFPNNRNDFINIFFIKLIVMSIWVFILNKKKLLGFFVLIITLLSVVVIGVFFKGFVSGYFNQEFKTNSTLPVPNMFEDCDSIIDVYRYDLKVFRPNLKINKDSVINEIKMKMDPVISLTEPQYRGLMNDPDFRILSDSTFNIFQDRIPYFNEIKNGFCRYKNFLRMDTINNLNNEDLINFVVYLNEDIFKLNQPNFTPPFVPINFAINPDDNSQWLLMGLHWFLGKDHVFYQSIPDYLRFRYDSIYMSSMIFNSIGNNYLGSNNMFNAQDDSFLASMISSAKPYFFAKCMLPEVEDYRIFGFTKFTDLDGNIYNEIEFAHENEAFFWKDIILTSDLLYSSNIDLKELYINPGPAINCPSRLGVWIGYQILHDYYQNNKELTLVEIMLESDYQKILNQSNYQP